jgi:hypothetical protein
MLVRDVMSTGRAIQRDLCYYGPVIGRAIPGAKLC